jgi:hypothetical protein
MPTKRQIHPAPAPKERRPPILLPNGLPYKKRHIPKAVREACWLAYNGKIFDAKCGTTWCQNSITVWDFQAGHKIPESKGGPTTLENLIPLCSRCNLSMSNNYTYKQWCDLQGQIPPPPQPSPPRPFLARLFSCFTGPRSLHPHEATSGYPHSVVVSNPATP